MAEKNINNYTPTLTGKVFRRLLLFLSIFLSLFMVITLLIQVPSIQNYFRKVSVNYLEKKLERKVSIGHLKLEWLSKVGLDSVYIQDDAQDTVIYAGHLGVSIDMSLIALLKGKFSVQDIDLRDVVVKDIKRTQDSIGSLADLIQHLFPPKATRIEQVKLSSHSNMLWLGAGLFFLSCLCFIIYLRSQHRGMKFSLFSLGFLFLAASLYAFNTVRPQFSKSTLDLNLKDISFQNIRYLQENIFNKTAISVYEGQVTIDQVDLERKIIGVSRVNIDRPTIHLTRLQAGTSVDSSDLFGDSLLNIYINELEIDHGSLRTLGWQPNTIQGGFLHELDGFKISLSDLKFNHSGLSLHLGDVHLVDKTDFGIHHFKADQVVFNPTTFQLLGYQLESKESFLADSITLSYDRLTDFKAFNDKVRIYFRSDNSRIYLEDLSRLVPSLSNIEFFRKNIHQSIRLDGILLGTINDLKSNRLKLKMDEVFDFDGKIDFTNLSKPEETFLSVRINALNTHSGVIKDIVPGISNLKNIDKLGAINFKGSFDGSFKDFVAYGFLKTDVGNSKMDMRLKTTRDINQAKYSGEIELIDFDLGKWTGDSKLGKVALKATVSDGSGLRAESASASLKSDIRKLEFNGYSYSNIQFDGVLNNRLVDGTVTMRDDNANLDFNGKIDYTNTIPSYDFKADIRKIDFNKLKLLSTSLTLSGKMDIQLTGRSLEELDGNIKLNQFIIQKDSTLTLLESLSLNAASLSPGSQKLTLQSDWVDGDISGSYSLKDLWPSLKNQLRKQFPDIVKSLKWDPEERSKQDTSIAQAYQYHIKVKDVRGISALTGKHIAAAEPFKVEGEVNEKGKYFLCNWNIPDLKLNEFKLFNSVGRVEAKGSFAFTSAYIDSTISKDFHLPQLVITADLSANKMNFSVKTRSVGELVNNISLNGKMELIDSTYHLHLGSSKVSFLDRDWEILPDNEIAFRSGYIQTKNLRFVHGPEKIEMMSVGTKGLKAEITNLGIDFLNKVVPLRQWQLTGKINLKAEVADAFNLEGLKVAGLIDSIFINKSYFGLFDINAYTPNMNQPINISLAMLDGTKQLIGEGFYDISGKFSNGIKNNYQFKCLFKDYPFRIFEYLIDDVVDNTRGNLQGNLTIRRINNQPDFSGKLSITDGGLKVNYLGTTYRIGTQPILVNNSMIDVTGVQLKDELGNEATLNGGLPHDHFKNIRLNAGLTSNRFLVLKTTKEQNPDYYGTLVGNIVARFYGAFNAINIDVQGTTARPSVLNIPINQATVVTSERLVSYRPKVTASQDTSKPRRFLASKGVSVSIDLAINNDAEIALIFDEKRGDILKGSGQGDIQMKFERSGDITMFGNYEVNQGEYLFTLLGAINKPFKIKQGGTIRWDGDPLSAQIDLDAEYKGLSSSLINLLPEYENTLGSAALRTQTTIDLGMHLFGALFHPEISFNIDIPNLTGDMRSIVDNKLNLLKSDQNALNQQVLGLMVWGSFLPPNQLVASSGVIGSTINNLSQFVSSQLSLLVENALKELIADNSVISGFEFDVNYYNNSNVVDINKAAVFDEYAVNLAPKFFEDRLKVDVGANFINSQLFDRLITPHFEVEYALTKDRRVTIRAYARKDDINQGQLKDRIGGGISWRKEFDSLKDFKRKLKEDLSTEKLQIPN